MSAGESKKVRVKHNKWNVYEDMRLKQIVLSMGSNLNWNQVASFFKNRNQRQCQERWEYYLRPDVNNGPWTPEEDELLLQKYNEYGSHWKVISKFFKGRTNTNVKNRYLALNRMHDKEEGKIPIFPEPSNNEIFVNLSETLNPLDMPQEIDILEYMCY